MTTSSYRYDNILTLSAMPGLKHSDMNKNSSSDHGSLDKVGNDNGDGDSSTVMICEETSSTATMVVPQTPVDDTNDGITITTTSSASQGPTTANNVGELMVKAKKAAASLWMILHAQNCRHREICLHPQCPETKLILAHVKSCPSPGPNCPCPTKFKGCLETRKLLSHYRRCKELRSRHTNRRSLPPHPDPPQSCLVCSLTARHVKNAMISTDRPPQLRRPRSESCPERKSRSVKFAPMRTTVYYSVEEGSSRRRSASCDGGSEGVRVCETVEEGEEEDVGPIG